MKRLRKLPRSGHWEIDLIQVPEIQVDGVELEGVLLVVDRAGGSVRQAQPVPQGSDLGGIVAQAATSPMPPNGPARPRTIRCPYELRGRLLDVARALRAKVRVTDDLPAVTMAVDTLVEHLETPSLVPSRPEPWRTVMGELLTATPWRYIPDTVRFRFPEGLAGLEDAVALVLGNAGEQLGVVVYPTRRDYELFREAAHSGGSFDGEWTCWCAHVDPVDQLQPFQVRDAERLDLVQEGVAMQLFAAAEHALRQLKPQEEEAALAAVQAVLGAWRAHGPDLVGIAQPVSVTTDAGEVSVRVEVDDHPSSEPEPLILDAQHRIAVTAMVTEDDDEEIPALVLKMAKRDALRLARLTEQVDGISLEPSPRGWIDVLAWVGPHVLGVLTRVGHDAWAWERWRELGEGLVVIAAGGAMRPRARVKDIVATLYVEFLDDEDAPPLFETFAPDGLDEAGREPPSDP